MKTKWATMICLLALALGFHAAERESVILTTGGPITPAETGMILPHEHIFTDLRGPTVEGYGDADPEEVERVMLPLLKAAREQGVSTLVECTTIGVGRNVPIIASLARKSGLNIVVPTGVYGRANFAPEAHGRMSEEELARWMIDEITNGIEGTDVRAGFVKTAASERELKPLEEKFLRASGRASKETGVVIASHTTKGEVAKRQADILEEMGVPLHRFIWVHAQAEKNLEHHKALAKRGVFIELDSVGGSDEGDARLVETIKQLKEAGFLGRVLISHDAGWYNPGQPNGGNQRGYTSLLESFLPRLKQVGFSDTEIRQLTRENPARAFGIPKTE